MDKAGGRVMCRKSGGRRGEEREGKGSGAGLTVIFNWISDAETMKRDCSLFYTMERRSSMKLSIAWQS